MKKRKGSPDANRIYGLNQLYFDKIDSEEKAYFLGFLYADGCNNSHKNTVAIALQKKDLNMLEKFKNAIEYSGPIYLGNENCKNSNVATLRVTSRPMCESLTKLGCLPKKSLILKFPTYKQVPKKFLRHFLRGVWDGDGCLNSYFTSKKSRTKTIICQLVSTIDFCYILRDVLSKELSINCTIANPICKTNDVSSRLKINSTKQSILLLDWLYKDSNIHLDRKYAKYLELKEYDNNRKKLVT